MSELKQMAARAAIEFIEDDMVIGVGTGTTVFYFIQELARVKHRIDACVASSKATEALLREANIPIIDLNTVADLPLYVDGADEVNARGEMIKGGGGALTREKIVANVAKHFICIVDESKVVATLGDFPVAVEVIPMARSFVARQLVTLGGDPEYREGFVTDNGNYILDVFNLPMDELAFLENRINNIPGVVDNGIFTQRLADKILVASPLGIKNLK
jgi:ribose 5-phosphate isomerase A